MTYRVIYSYHDGQGANLFNLQCPNAACSSFHSCTVNSITNSGKNCPSVFSESLIHNHPGRWIKYILHCVLHSDPGGFPSVCIAGNCPRVQMLFIFSRLTISLLKKYLHSTFFHIGKCFSARNANRRGFRRHVGSERGGKTNVSTRGWRGFLQHAHAADPHKKHLSCW